MPWRARAEDLIFPGIQPKASAGAGQTVSRGGVAVFYNPANIIFSKFIEPFIDLSFAKVTYTYQQVDTDAFKLVTIPVTTPALTVGASFRPVEGFALGFGFYPTAGGKAQAINAVPVPIGARYQALDIVQTNSGYKLGLGLAYRLDYFFAVGAGLVRSSEQTHILTYVPLDDKADPGAERIPLVDAVYGGAWNQFILGLRSELFERTVAIGLSYKTAVTKTYAATSTICLATACGTADKDPEYSPYEGVGYSPAVVGFGVEARFGAFGGFLDFVHEFWSKGRLIYKRGLGPDPDGGVDYIDTNNFCVGGKFWLAPKHMLTAAFGKHDANVGLGTVTEVDTAAGLRARGEKNTQEAARRNASLAMADATAEDPVVGGVTFGSLEAVPRTIFAGGYRMKLQGAGYLEAGFQYTKGSRAVPEGASGAGMYTLNVILVSIGVAYGF